MIPIDRLQYLFRQYAANVATADEVEELFYWLRETDEENESIIEELTRRAAQTAEDKNYDEARWEKVLQSVLLKVGQQPATTEKPPVYQMNEPYESKRIPDSSRIGSNRRWWAAAAVLFAAALGVYLWSNSSKKSDHLVTVEKNNKETNDALPGRERAILKLANGKTILLDSTQGNIMLQKGLTAINENGKLGYKGTAETVEFHEMTTPRGGQYQLTLPDGTNVWLNAASSISYPTAFVGRERVVSITGEVYFEVAKDKTKPFRVKVKEMEVEVLGTHFNINSYDEEELIKTTLLEGSVRVITGIDSTHAAIPAKSFLLAPGQQAQVLEDKGNIKGFSRIVSDADVEQVMAWKNGSFQFENTPLTVVMRQLSRWYDVDVVYEAGVPDIKLGGEMKRDLNLSQVLNGLKKLGVKTRIEGKKLMVLR